jgi:hypothetical protein
MMTRIFNYANKLLHLNDEIRTITESRPSRNNRRYTTSVIAGSLFTMVLCRLGSFNSFDRNKDRRIWKRLLGRNAAPGSADTLGRRSAQIDANSVQALLLRCNRRMRRCKALRPLRKGGYAAVVIDGHEVGCSYLRDFGESPCLQREIDYNGGKRTQYYQRLVTAVLVCDGHTQLLDVEMQLPGEDEVAAALRLLERISPCYSHLFDVVMADGLYAQAPFFKAVRAMNKHVIAVLKNERRDLTQDVRSLLPITQAVRFKRGKEQTVRVEARDIENLETWTRVGLPVRVVHTVETSTRVRQACFKKNCCHVKSKPYRLNGCGLPRCHAKPFPPKTSSIRPITGGTLKTNALTSCQPIGMPITFTNTTLMPF